MAGIYYNNIIITLYVYILLHHDHDYNNAMFRAKSQIQVSRGSSTIFGDDLLLQYKYTHTRTGITDSE